MTNTTIDAGDYVALENLPDGDPALTTPLHVIGAEFMHVKEKVWHQAADSGQFYGFTYNDLLGPWVTFHRWRIRRETLTALRLDAAMKAELHGFTPY